MSETRKVVVSAVSQLCDSGEESVTHPPPHTQHLPQPTTPTHLAAVLLYQHVQVRVKSFKLGHAGVLWPRAGRTPNAKVARISLDGWRWGQVHHACAVCTQKGQSGGCKKS